MFTNATNKIWSLVMTGLVGVDGFKLCIQVCVWLGFATLLDRKDTALLAKYAVD